MPITLEGERGVADVLESPRTGHGGFLRHLPDKADGNAARFGYSGQRVRHLHDLRNATSAPIHICRGDGLDRVDDDERQIRPERVYVSDDIREVCFVCEIQVLVVDTYSRCPHGDLVDAFLTRYVQCGAAGTRSDGVRDVEQQGALASPRLTADE